jgi:hypothetical protein
MSVITKGKTFANGEQLTAGKLNQMLDAAVFSSAAVDNTKTTLSGGAITIAPNSITSTEVAQSFLDSIYPIGSIYTNATDGTNPGTLLGFGTWVSFGAGRVPVGIDSSGSPDTDFDTAEETGGAKTHTLTEAEMPSHSHLTVGDRTTNSTPTSVNSIAFTSNQSSGNNDYTLFGGGTQNRGITNSKGSSEAHNNLQPYIVVYMWKRTG